MVKESYVKLNIKLCEDNKIWEACGHKTITICSYLDVFLELDGFKVKMDIEDLIPLLKHLNMFKYFKEKTMEEINKLQNYFITYENEKGYIIKDSNKIYCNDINISYYKDHYTIVLANEEGRYALIDIWNKYLEDLENGKKK